MGPTRKTAFLILVHHQPAHLARLIRPLVPPRNAQQDAEADWARVFVHVDRKVDDAPFRRHVGENDGVTFLNDDERVEVHWSGFSVVRATLALLRRALAAGESFARFCLLSGADFPIKPAAHIRERFAGDEEFLRVDRRLGGREPGMHLHTVRRFYFADLPEKRHLSGQIFREPYRGIPLYYGSQWWSLTDRCVGLIMDFVERHPGYSEFHKWTYAPDEIFFHSIIKSSPCADKITHDFERAPSYDEFMASHDRGCTYVDWTNIRRLKLLGEEDYEALARSRCLFARKVDEERSRSLIERIEADRFSLASGEPRRNPDGS